MYESFKMTMPYFRPQDGAQGRLAYLGTGEYLELCTWFERDTPAGLSSLREQETTRASTTTAYRTALLAALPPRSLSPPGRAATPPPREDRGLVDAISPTRSTNEFGLVVKMSRPFSGESPRRGPESAIHVAFIKRSASLAWAPAATSINIHLGAHCKWRKPDQ